MTRSRRAHDRSPPSRRRAAVAALAAAILAAGGCSSRSPHPETVAGAGAGTFWLAGTHGYAAFFDGRALVRVDYPRAQSNSRYDAGSVPVARVVTYGTAALLITRPGDVLRFAPAAPGRENGWEPLGNLLPSEHDQVDLIALAPDALVMFTNSRRVLTYAMMDLAGGSLRPAREEPAPTYFAWIGYVRAELYGAGWDTDGNTPAVWRRAPEGWQVAARWPTRRGMRARVRGVFPWNGELVAIDGEHLLPFNPELPDAARAPLKTQDLGLGYLCHVHAAATRPAYVESCSRDRVLDADTGALHEVPRGAAALVGVLREPNGFRAYYADGATKALGPPVAPQPAGKPLPVAADPEAKPHAALE